MTLSEARKKVKVVQKIINEFTITDTMTEAHKKSKGKGLQIDEDVLHALEQRRKRYINRLDDLLK